MKKALFILAFLALCGSAQATDKLISTDVLTDTTFVQNLFFAGADMHATAGNASVTISDASGVKWKWSVSTVKNSDGTKGPFEGSVPCQTHIIVTLTNCTLTLYRRIE